MIEHIQKQLTIPREYHNQRIDSVLAHLLPDYSRSQISSWIKSGTITLNHQSCKPKDKVEDGDLIEINVDFNKTDVHLEHCVPEEIPLNIIYEDEDVLVLNKPAHMVVHPGAGNKEHTLVNALLHHAPSLTHLPRAGIVHRLDKDTTGLLIVAKTLPAHTSLIRQMQAREIKRHYITLVQGHIISGGTIDTGFGRHPRNRLKMAVQEHGKQAITHYSVKKQYHDFTLLDVNLMTGRTHQIRVHLAYIHHPVVGDPLYGTRMRFPTHASEHLRTLFQNFKRQALHARTLSFYHPKTEKELTLMAPMPDDFKLLLNTLDEHYED
ncbi:23S rRNA pseudouridine(1911/1915/1917) synthase RluD [Legionella cincinnatiensis]|uniref:Pseudouridine synthase n=1 Tax=Legionella cincinnatiensis TaxID=28085 RepID=A0A378IIP6_9GAMM|nr:23S rRNA pseudouridine(1911/1915/1917) synthase RluD [Legionella cincinnatiensis]KTC81767.1 uracil hydrolyase [Legionella cincinnatiensis]STX34575.1 uracil hydrolyase [Legionella cincinnatiensis]